MAAILFFEVALFSKDISHDSHLIFQMAPESGNQNVDGQMDRQMDGETDGWMLDTSI